MGCHGYDHSIFNIKVDLTSHKGLALGKCDHTWYLQAYQDDVPCEEVNIINMFVLAPDQ